MGPRRTVTSPVQGPSRVTCRQRASSGNRPHDANAEPPRVRSLLAWREPVARSSWSNDVCVRCEESPSPSLRRRNILRAAVLNQIPVPWTSKRFRSTIPDRARSLSASSPPVSATATSISWRAIFDRYPGRAGARGSRRRRGSGRDVAGLRPGDHVVACLSVFCGHCPDCISGRPALCEARGNGALGQPPRQSRDGAPVHRFAHLSAFAEQMLVHEYALVKIRPDMPLDRAALIGCAVTTGAGAVINTAKVPPGSTVAVLGCGGVGLNCVQGAALAGASRIIAVDTLAGNWSWRDPSAPPTSSTPPRRTPSPRSRN